MQVILPILISLSISLLCIIIFFLLAHKYIKDKDKSYKTHALTRLLSFLIVFIFVDAVFYTLLYSSQYGFISPIVFYTLLQPSLHLVPQLGIFISVVFIVHFLLEKHIERFKDTEDSLMTLEELNKELDKKAMELESNQENLQKKVYELERFNDIAKEMERNMVVLIRKIETLERKLSKK